MMTSSSDVKATESPGDESSKAPSQHEGDLTENRAGNLIVITGPSGVGKGTVVERILAEIPGVKRSVSVTTRPKRESEIEGVDYFFKTEEQFQEIRQEKELLEWAEFAGNHYGTPRQWVIEELKKGNDVLLEIEVQGAIQIQERFPSAVLIFLAPPRFDVLEDRLRKRGTEPSDKIELRLRKGRQEMEQMNRFHFHVVNDNLEKAVQDLVHIIYAERCRMRNP